MTKFHGRMVLFFTILNIKVPLPLMPHAEFQHTYMNLLYLLLLAMAAFLDSQSTYLEFLMCLSIGTPENN